MQPAEREYFLTHEERYRVILRYLGDLGNLGSLRKPKKKKPLRLLDVGCYPYHLGAAMEGMGFDVWGISSSHEPIHKKKVKICNIETDKFPFESNFFDLVLCTEVLEHLPQSPAHTIRQMYRVAKPGGRLLVTTPNIARSINRAKLLLGKSVTYPLSHVLEDTNIYHRHNREYTLHELETLIEHAGWKITEASYFVSYTPMRRRVRLDSLPLKLGKWANYLLMLAFPAFRDTLLILAKK